MTTDEIIVPGSIEWLGKMLGVAMSSTDEARRRFYRCTDEVARLRRDLSAAEERLSEAEREYNAQGKLLREMWDQTRGELENARPPKVPLVGVEDDGYHDHDGPDCPACALTGQAGS